MKKVLIYIQSTDGGVRKYKEKGFWDRQKFVLSKIGQEYKVYYFTADIKNYQSEMPEGVTHKVAPYNIPVYGISHILFYLYLISSSVFWKKNYIIRVWGTSIPVLGIVKKISGAKLIVSYQYDWATGVKKDYKGVKTWIADWVQKDVIDSADGIICTMDWLVKILKKKYNSPNVVLIPNFVNTDLFYPITEKKNIIIFCGRLHWSKGVDDLIKAFNIFHSKNKSWLLYIVGDGEEKKNLKTIPENKDAVIFLGMQPYYKVAEFLNQAKIFVLPTKTMEGHPKAMVEAMAAGCICIGSNVPGNKDILTDAGSSDLIFEAGNFQDLAQKLELAVKLKEEGIDEQYEFSTHSYGHNNIIPKELAYFDSFLTK